MADFETTMYDFNKLSLMKRIQEKIDLKQGWEEKGEIFIKKTNLRAAITYGITMIKKDMVAK